MASLYDEFTCLSVVVRMTVKVDIFFCIAHEKGVVSQV